MQHVKMIAKSATAVIEANTPMPIAKLLLMESRSFWKQEVLMLVSS